MKEQCSLSEAAVPGKASNCQQWCTAMTVFAHELFASQRWAGLDFIRFWAVRRCGVSRSSVTIVLNMRLCEHWAMLGVSGWEKRKNKCKTASQAHYTVSVSMWISQESWTSVFRALLLSLTWMTLYCVKDLILSKSLEVLGITILSAPKLNIVDSTFIFADFSWAFTSWYFVIFWGG